MANKIKPTWSIDSYQKATELWIFPDHETKIRALKSSKENSSRFNYVINADGTFPFDFSDIDMPGCEFQCHGSRVTSLKGIPRSVKTVEMSDVGCDLTSLEGAPIYVKVSVNIENSGIMSLSGIGKDYLCHCPKITIPMMVNSSILGLLKIKEFNVFHLERFTSLKIPNMDDVNQLTAMKILNKYVNSKDILSCQEELIENGLKEYARL